jgi:hypothetical protein
MNEHMKSGCGKLSLRSYRSTAQQERKSNAKVEAAYSNFRFAQASFLAVADNSTD